LYQFSTSLPFLLTRLGVRMGELFSRELAREGLTLPMFRVLAALSEQGEPQRLGALAALTSVEASTLSRLLGQMQRIGLITRERPEADQRSLAVMLAPLGTATAARLIPRAAHYEAIATGDLSAQEAAGLKTVLERVRANLPRLERELEAQEEKTALPKPRARLART
jgi:DNA-binding MarR family transcriptional regulator